MTEKEKVKTVSAISPTVEVSTNQQQQAVENKCHYCDYAQSQSRNDERKDTWHCSECNKDWYLGKELITLTGITTSQINQALKADNPYPARVFLKVDNQEEDIPIFFRIKEGNNWIKPKIKKGSYLAVEGYFSIGTVYTKQAEKKSFTATSYQVLNSQLNQEITANHDWK